MTYEELCKYVFKEERVDWELHNICDKKRDLSTAKHFCIYLGNWFYPLAKPIELVEPLGLDRSSFYSAMKNIRDLSIGNPEIRRRKEKYLRVIGYRAGGKVPVNESTGTVMIKLTNRRVTVKRIEEGYSIRLKRLSYGKVEESKMSVSFDAMDAIVNAYNLLK